MLNKNTRTVLFIATSTAVGGMERVMAGVAKRLAEDGVAVEVLLSPSGNEQEIVGWFGTRGVAARTHPAAPDVHQTLPWRQMMDFTRLAASLRVDAVNLHYGVGHISLKDVLAVRLAGRRCVATVHAAPGWGPEDRRVMRATRWASMLCDRVIAHSQATRAHLMAAGVASAKIACIPCGLEPPARTPTRAEARVKLGVCDEAFVVSAAARLVPEKGLDTLLEAVCDLRALAPPPLLLIAGAGPDDIRLRAMGARLLGDRVRFLGHVADLSEMYAASDVFALPSLMEGFGLVYLEAAQHGVPSIGTNVGAIPEVIQDGVTGALVPVGDAKALASSIRALACDPQRRQALGQAARRRVVSEFGMERMGEQYRRALFGRSR
ncbi:glycoside hydrolase [Capsulimonas corticalis]|uniref:Glycoside hydrolase n=1 Tax=Capsulimonas corticalis TaxID=2219043 RepID=A0A402D052_9BACT|nr:glycosyltransferase family 4 protein [Capsulimonas corticalis]BDI33775.1 glycoside hydrolase [Capsulimonas corticalis]